MARNVTPGTLETSLTRARKLETKIRVNKAAHEGGWRLRFHLRRSWNFPLQDFLDDGYVFFKGDPMLCRSKARTFALRLSVALNLAATRSGSFIRCDSQLSKIVPQNRPKCGCSASSLVCHSIRGWRRFKHALEMLAKAGDVAVADAFGDAGNRKPGGV